MKNKSLIRLLLTAVLLFGFSSAGANTIKWSMAGDSLTLDPHAQNEGPTTQVSRQVYEALVTRGLDMQIGPQLATKWKAVDATTWYFFLREDVKFHDGSYMTSEDVVFSIIRAQQPTSDFKEYISSISSVKAIDKYTVQIKTKEPNPILLNQLSNIFVMSKAWSAKNFSTAPQNWNASQETYASTNTMGTGPFKITLREPNTKTVFKKNGKWWGNVEHNLTSIELLPIANAATRVAALLSGEIDIVTDAPVQDLGRIGSSATHKVESTPQMRTIFLGMDQAADQLRSGNTGDNPFKKKEVRQALYQAIDIDAIKKKVMRGDSEPAGIITFPGVTGYTKDLDKRLPYDPKAAKQLLADAGYPDGFDVELRCPNDRYVNDEAICTAVVGMFGKIGVNVSLNAQTKSKHFKELKEDKSDFYMLGWGVPTLDSHYVFHYLYDSGASWNKVNFSNARVDELIKVMEGEVDLTKRNAAISEAWKIVKDDISYLPLHHQVISWASAKNVNVPIRPNNEPLFRFSSKN
ncbi:ABC transporter substrate-binding protein [Candidatus Pelagibacter ubique]|jgi:peptide/nickel transport system substrate-binding protein|nr:ABC transporter substrate-binding protein [Candidatus Pelagibacter ubique]MDA9203029.1 ABC transporter substrate-binding protein [Candidatus Pelagibacter ubique]